MGYRCLFYVVVIDDCLINQTVLLDVIFSLASRNMG
jgi:hypothetical protein